MSAAKCSVVQVSEIVELGGLDPEAIVTPGIFVKRVVQVAANFKAAASGGRALVNLRAVLKPITVILSKAGFLLAFRRRKPQIPRFLGMTVNKGSV